jgi:sugar lactone lactonase YvrE
MKRSVSLSGLLAAFVLAGCAGSTPQPFVASGVTESKIAGNTGAVRGDASYNIFILENNPPRIVEYSRDCEKLIADFPTGTVDPEGIAIDKKGKIYVANGNDDEITTYVNQKRSTPTIRSGISFPVAVTVGNNGEIFVANSETNTITTYDSKGLQQRLTIHKALEDPQGLSVDDSGKLYVTNELANQLNTYAATGRETHPTIIHLDGPFGVVATKSYIYVANSEGGTIGVYTSKGKLYHTDYGFTEPTGIALTPAGEVIAVSTEKNRLYGPGKCNDVTGLGIPVGVALEPINN